MPLWIDVDRPRAKWKAIIKEDPDTQEVIYDKKGKDGALRVAVPVNDWVRLSNFTEDSKEFQQFRAEKNLDAAAQEARRKDIVSNHNSEDAMCRASQIARSGAGGNGFIGRAFDFDFEALVTSVADGSEEKDEGDEEIEQPGPGSQPSSNGKGGGTDKDSDITSSKPKQGKKRAKDEADAPKPAKKKQWDRETVVASRIRSENTALCTLEVQLTQRLGECREALATLQSKGQDCSDEAKIEKVTLEKRTVFLSAIMETTAGQLKALIAEYDRQIQAAEQKNVAAAAAPTVVTSWEAQLETSPPCESFRQLTTLASWKDSVENLWSATSAADLKELAKTRCTERRPILELSQACKTGVKELQKAMAAVDSRRKQKAEGTRPSTKRAAAGGTILWETGLDVAKAVSEVTCAADEVGHAMLVTLNPSS